MVQSRWSNRNLILFPRLQTFEIGTMSTSNHFVSSAGIDHSLPLNESAWVIDTGASCHVCFDLTRFTDTHLISNTVVTLPDGNRIEVTISGSVILSTHLILHNLLFLPHFKFNLLSISALTANTSFSVLFSSHSCYIFPFNPLPLIQEHTQGSMIRKGNLHQNLYLLESSVPAHNTIAHTHTLAQISSDTWYQRLGHPSFNKIQQLAKTLEISSFQIPQDHVCKVCPLAKQKRLSFPSSENIYSSAFELLHVDIWGPFHVPTIDEYKYFFTIVDDHTRVTWLYLLKTKSSVQTVFPDFLTYVETQFNAKVKSIRSDNAPELSFNSLLKTKGLNLLVMIICGVLVAYVSHPHYLKIEINFLLVLLLVCVFGYPNGYKGYKVLDLTTNVISISRNVIFHETTFPFF